MFFWQNLFGKSSDKFQALEDRLTFHEQKSEQNLHTTHPHLKGIFDKHEISLRNIRKHTPKIAAATAVLGAFLAIPYLIGHPIQTTPSPQPPRAGQTADPSPSPGSNSSPEEYGQPDVSANQKPPPSVGTNSTPTPPDQTDESKSRGHIFGRSYLAPPKEHGFHDLGLHKGEAKNPKVPEVGLHPSDLEVTKGGKNS